VTKIQTMLDLPIQEAEAKVRAALGKQGFGVLTEIDVAATLREKLGVTRAPLKILGACNPDFANRALTIDPSVSLVLPCNVVLETVGSATRVDIADPRDLMPGVELAELVEEAAGQLEAVIETLEVG
jgi:uncharacterized protein (DUF302 family)